MNEITKAARAIKESGSWTDYKAFVEYMISDLSDIEKIKDEIELQANKKAVKVLRDILYII